LETAAGVKSKAVSDEADKARRFLLDRIDAGDGATPIKEAKTAAAGEGISSTALDKARSTGLIEQRPDRINIGQCPSLFRLAAG
jgi:hypothetical protein